MQRYGNNENNNNNNAILILRGNNSGILYEVNCTIHEQQNIHEKEEEITI